MQAWTVQEQDSIVLPYICAMPFIPKDLKALYNYSETCAALMATASLSSL